MLRLKKKFLVCLITSFFAAAKADNFTILLQGEDLKNAAVIDLKLIVEPKKSITFNEEFYVITIDSVTKQKIFWKDKILFKYFSPINTSLKIFFQELLNQDKVYLVGNFERNNYSGPVEITLKEKHLIPDFNKSVDPSRVKVNFIASTEEEVLPFLGISQAKVLGPKERIYSPKMRVSIGDVETYGFKLSGKISEARINGSQAKIFDDKIISTFIDIKKSSIDKNLDIELELEVDNRTIKKTIGSIHIIEAIQQF